MKKVALGALVAVGMMLAVTAPSRAREGERHGHDARFAQHRVFEGRRGFEGHRAFHHWGGPRIFIGVGPSFAWGATYPYGGYAAQAYSYAPPPAYWYYCPSYGAYYPNVASCPEPWVPVPAAP
jgi:hypothetical protein